VFAVSIMYLLHLLSREILMCQNMPSSEVRASSAKSIVFDCSILALAFSGCGFMTDAATRLGDDVVNNARMLRRDSGVERTFVHEPRSSPDGCSAGYTVKFQASLNHPASGGSLLVGCKGETNFRALGYSYSTTYHLNAVRVPSELSADKENGASLQVTLRKQGDTIDVVTIK
jgi:hypothetical protein